MKTITVTDNTARLLALLQGGSSPALQYKQFLTGLRDALLANSALLGISSLELDLCCITLDNLREGIAVLAEIPGAP